MIKLKEICRKALAVVLSTVTVLATAGISQAVYAYGSDSVRYEQVFMKSVQVVTGNILL